MSEPMSDKSLLRGLNAGTASGAAKLDREYRQKLHALADRAMDNGLRHREDPEDIVQSVLGTVFRRTAQGQLHFEHASELWRLLETVTRHKIIKHAEYHKAKKRAPKAEENHDANALLAREPTPDERAVAKDLIAKLLEGLDQSYSKIALLLRDGHSERAIAEQLSCTRSAVTTKIGRLRKRLQTLLEKDNDDSLTAYETVVGGLGGRARRAGTVGSVTRQAGAGNPATWARLNRACSGCGLDARRAQACPKGHCEQTCTSTTVEPWVR